MSTNDKQEESVQTAVRIPKSWLPRIDRVAERMSQPGVHITRTEALRAAVHRGLVEMEAEGKKR